MKSVEVVCALIKNDKDEIFCCQRGPGRVLVNLWEFPGGKVEKGETLEETIVREIKEELSADIRPIKYITTVEHTYPDTDGYPGFHIKLHAYMCEIVKGDLILSEHIDSKWVKLSDMDSIDFAYADVLVINELRK